MLRIEKVFLQGFKSFCDATEVVFDPDGITAVVGPNGCGKSNVADALNWVIGEQRVKMLRGGKMEDVIFQGSRNRQPSGLAEVILTLRVSESFEVRTQESVKEEFSFGKAEDAKLLDLNNDYQTQVESEAATESPAISTRQKPHRKTFPKQITHQYESGERITIGRRLYRTGDSEYEMNGRLCRLRDIQDLFAGTGLGSSHYAIIEQGRIGQVLSAKPLDRRALIEEAAGISKFKLRQRAAELKLEAAKQNLSRVTDIINEVDRQQGSLKRQAAKARRYQRLREEMRGLMRAVYVADHDALNQATLTLAEARQDTLNNESTLMTQIAEAEAQRVNTAAAINTKEAELLAAREAVSNFTLQSEKALQQQAFFQQQLSSLAQRTEESSRDQIAISERGQFTEQQVTRLKDELQALEQAINTEAASLSAAEAEHQTQVKSEREIENELEAAQAKVTEFATLRERWRQLANQFNEAVERATRQMTGLTTEQERAQHQEQELSTESERIALALESLVTQQSQTNAALAAAEAALTRQIDEQKISTAKLAQLRQDLTAIEQRRLSLCELDEQKSYFSEAVQAITRVAKNQNGTAPFKILGTLADFVAVNASQEKMIELGLREEMQYLIAQTFDDALNAIEFLRQGNYGRATFLVLDNGQHSTPASSFGVAENKLIDLLGLKPELRDLLEKALPRLSETIVAPEISQAIKSSIQSNGKGQSYLTTSGEFISAGHLITGGSAAEQGAGILALKREIAELQEKLNDLTAQVETSENRVALLAASITEQTSTRQALDQTLRQHEKELALLRGQQQQNEREVERARTHLRVVEVELQQATNECADFQNKAAHAQTEFSTAEQSLKAAEVAAQTMQAQVTSLRQTSTERAQELSRRRADFAAKSERRNALQQEIRRLENEVKDISERLSMTQLEALEAAEKINTIQTSLKNLQEELTTTQALLVEATAEVNHDSEEVARLKATLITFDEQLNHLRTTLTQLREDRSQIEIDRAKLSANLEHLAASCYAELGETIDDLIEKFQQAPSEELAVSADAEEIVNDEIVSNETKDETDDDDEDAPLGAEPVSRYQMPANFELEAAKIRLTELRNKIENIGPVNLLALEELGELEQRFIFLIEQKADIEQAVADTQAAISEIKKRSREKFIEAFHEINKNFSEMFIELFGGGHGEMRLIDETDVLESGIDIIAQPPGKRLQSVLLLSGGEKAMAALALVMGIFKYRPSPFCLLDEVDAPLDDANIGRFASKVIDMSRNTQFIVITHSKQTMEAASTLYGVTMQDPGVSKLISVKLT